jgi:outer membrane receptor protein involved in Fe transport
LIAFILVFSVLLVAQVSANSIPFTERLAFIGEDVEVVTIASGKPELPQKAPAVASVYLSSLLERRGYRTLGEALKDVPGFFVYQGKKRSHIIVRGVPSGALFLFDGVPLTSDISKEVYKLDEDMNLYYVKRLEVIRGPGSVLWGPDAFSGIVNVVPFKGRDIGGLKFKFLGGTPREDRGFYLIAGDCKSGWDYMFYSGITTKRDYSDKHTKRYTEVVSSVSYGDFADFTFRYTKSELPVEERFSEKKWYSKDNYESYLAKLVLKKTWGPFSFKLKNYFLKNNVKEVNDRFSWEYSSRVYHGEASFSLRTFNGKGLFVAGASLRRNFVHNGVIRVRSFIPDYLNVADLEPLVDRRDFDTTLKSVFGQYVHRLGKFSFWAGVRWDKHTDYKSGLTYNLGVGWFPKRKWAVKLSYGEAYRTPYAAQFLRRSNMDPEKISTLSLSVSRKNERLSLEAVAFYSFVKDHIGEEVYGGFSKPSDQHINGLEISAKVNVLDNIDFWTSMSFIHHYGDAEKYRVLKYILYTPAGFQYNYEHLKKPYFTGPETFASFGMTWLPLQNVTFSAVARYHSSYSSYSLKQKKSLNVDNNWSLDAFLDWKVRSNISVSLKLENLFSDKQESLGRYDLIRTDGVKAYLLFSVKF